MNFCFIYTDVEDDQEYIISFAKKVKFLFTYTTSSCTLYSIANWYIKLILEMNRKSKINFRTKFPLFLYPSLCF